MGRFYRLEINLAPFFQGREYIDEENIDINWEQGIRSFPPFFSLLDEISVGVAG